jgi:hypothetical protein
MDGPFMPSRLPKIPGILALLLGFVATPGLLPAQQAGDWAVGSATARMSLEVDKGSKPSALTWTDLYLPNPRWIGQTIGVFNDSGQRVASEVLSNPPGGPLILVFDSSSNAQHYDVYFGSSDWPPLPLKDDHGAVILETRDGDGKEIDKLPDMLDAWNKATVVEGKLPVPGIFEGGNRFGPQRNLLLHFHTFFNAVTAEHVDFATVSTDSSFVLVDGKEVVEWPGAHDAGGGMREEHQGGVDLTAGPHELDYYNDYFQPGGPPLVACLAVKGGPVTKWTMTTADCPFLPPTAHAHVIDYAVSGTSAPPMALTFTGKDQSMIEHDVADAGFITVTLTCVPPQDGTVNWTFDDVTTATGQTVDHLFPRPGLRTVQMQVEGINGSVPATRQIINVHPDWYLLTTVPPDLHAADATEILSRDPATFLPADLAGCMAVFGTYKSVDALYKFAPAVTAHLKDMADGDLHYIKSAIDVMGTDLTHASVTEPLLQALVDRCGTTPTLLPIGSWARLNLAQMMLQTTDRTTDVAALLAGVNAPSLSGEDQRHFAIAQADLLLATGKIDEARKKYTDITGSPGGVDSRSSVRETGEIGQAQVFLGRKDDESAEDSLNEVAWLSPIQKVTPEWTLARLRLYEDENLPDVALIYGKRLLAVIPESEQSELLYRLTELAAQKGNKDLADKTLAELLEKHAYSEEAAKAKAKWPGGV